MSLSHPTTQKHFAGHSPGGPDVAVVVGTVVSGADVVVVVS